MGASRGHLEKSLIRWLILFCAASCSLMPLWLISARGVDIPNWDDWTTYAAFLVKLHTHQVTLHDFFAQGAEHRLFMPRVIFSLFTIWGWNALRIMRVEWGLVCITSVGILRLLIVTQPLPTGRKGNSQKLGQSPDGPHPSPPPEYQGRGQELPRAKMFGDIFGKRQITIAIAFQWLMCNLFIFCLNQWENWIWDTGLANVMPIMFTVGALLVVTSGLRPWPKVILTVLCCAAAEYSSGNGFLSWILAGIVLGWSDSRQELWGKRWILTFYFICAAVFMGVYFIGFNWNSASADGFAKSFGQAISFVIVFLGNIAPNETFRWILGGMLLGLYAISGIAFINFWKRGADRQIARNMLVWLMIGAFAIGSAVMAAPRRAGYGLWQAGASRYTTFSLYLIVSVIVLIPMILNRLRQTTRNAFACAAQAVIYAGLLFSLFSGFNDALRSSYTPFSARARAGKCGLILYKALPDNFAVQFLTNLDDHGYSLTLELNRLGLLHVPLVQSNVADDFRADDPAISGAIVGSTSQDGKIVVNGWSFNQITDHPADVVFVSYQDAAHRNIILALANIVDGTYQINADSEGDRSFSIHGWKIALPSEMFPNDLQHTVLTAWALSSETGKATALGNPVAVKLVNGKN